MDPVSRSPISPTLKSPEITTRPQTSARKNLPPPLSPPIETISDKVKFLTQNIMTIIQQERQADLPPVGASFLDKVYSTFSPPTQPMKLETLEETLGSISQDLEKIKTAALTFSTVDEEATLKSLTQLKRNVTDLKMRTKTLLKEDSPQLYQEKKALINHLENMIEEVEPLLRNELNIKRSFNPSNSIEIAIQGSVPMISKDLKIQESNDHSQVHELEVEGETYRVCHQFLLDLDRGVSINEVQHNIPPTPTMPEKIDIVRDVIKEMKEAGVEKNMIEAITYISNQASVPEAQKRILNLYRAKLGPGVNLMGSNVIEPCFEIKFSTAPLLTFDTVFGYRIVNSQDYATIEQGRAVLKFFNPLNSDYNSRDALLQIHPDKKLA